MDDIDCNWGTGSPERVAYLCNPETIFIAGTIFIGYEFVRLFVISVRHYCCNISYEKIMRKQNNSLTELKSMLEKLDSKVTDLQKSLVDIHKIESKRVTGLKKEFKKRSVSLL